MHRTTFFKEKMLIFSSIELFILCTALLNLVFQLLSLSVSVNQTVESKKSNYLLQCIIENYFIKIKTYFPRKNTEEHLFCGESTSFSYKVLDLISEREEKNHIDRSAPNCLCLTSSNKILKKFWFVRFCGFSNEFHFCPFKVISYSWQSIAAVKHKIQCFNVSI